MFWAAEDIQPVVNAATGVFGPQAQYHMDPYVYISVETPKYGCVWYGDVSGDFGTVRERAMTLTAKLGEKITVREMGTSNIIV
jgi:hypothetical protein